MVDNKVLQDSQPEALRFLRARFGDEVAFRFIERFIGREFVISSPASINTSADASEIIEAFGADVLNAIHAEYHYVPFRVPTARAFRYEFYARQGLSTKEIAPRLGISLRQTYHIASQYKKRRAAKFQKWKQEAEQ